MQFAVIGLGSFGSAIAGTLIDNGHEVIVVDQEEERVQRFADRAVEPLVGDATSEILLRDLGPKQLDVIIVGIADDVEASVLICMTLLDLGARHLVAKAEDDKHAKILRRIGVHRVVQPERDSAWRVAEVVSHPRLVDKIDISDSHAIIEMKTPPSFRGKTLRELNLRAKHQALILAIRRPEEPGGERKTMKFIAPPDPEDKLGESDILIIMSPKEKVSKIENLG